MAILVVVADDSDSHIIEGEDRIAYGIITGGAAIDVGSNEHERKLRTDKIKATNII
jgi:hypothetical protein